MWIFGPVLCKLNNFVALLSVSLSVFTLLAISLDRRKVTLRQSILYRVSQKKCDPCLKFMRLIPFLEGVANF